jgi:hypothetical protein
MGFCEEMGIGSWEREGFGTEDQKPAMRGKNGSGSFYASFGR